MMYRILVLAVLVQISSISMADVHSVHPKDGYVPNAETAIKIAEAVWIPIYGQDVLTKKPFVAKFANDRWIVEGTFSKSGAAVGGVPIIEISKKSGEILRVSHGK